MIQGLNMTEAKLKKLTIRIPEDLHKKMKIKCAETEESMNNAIEKLIRNYLKQ